MYAAKANEVAKMGSIQINENFNQLFASKAPKRLWVHNLVSNSYMYFKVAMYVSLFKDLNIITVTGIMEAQKVSSLECLLQYVKKKKRWL